jgi:uncharacterized membrane protein YkvA (DUF1232 family)
VLFRRLLGDDRIPRGRKLLLAASVAYLAMPVDLVPDFIPVAASSTTPLSSGWRSAL